MNVSLCMIVRNEAAHLARCLESVRSAVQEIVVVDTGSADKSREIALAHGAKVFDFPWCDDFAAARNESIRRASCPWIFWMDADDHLDAHNLDAAMRVFASLREEPCGYLMQCASFTSSGALHASHPLVRLFPNDPRICWERRTYGFSCTSWIGIQDANHAQGNGGLVQVTVASMLPTSASTAFDESETPTYSTTSLGVDGLDAIYSPRFDWTSGTASVGIRTGLICPGDSVHALIQIIDIGSSLESAPGPEQLVVVYFANLTQNWYSAFQVRASDLGANVFSRFRSAVWTLEQFSGSSSETPRGGVPTTSNVIPLARHSTVYFTDAVCGTWLGLDDEQVPINPFTLSLGGDDVKISGYDIHYPGEASWQQRAYIVDYSWNYIWLPLAPALAKGAKLPIRPPLGPATLPGSLGTVVSTGQLVAKNIVMCKYVYPYG